MKDHRLRPAWAVFAALAALAAAGAASVGVLAASSGPLPPQPVPVPAIDAAHVPPLLTLPGEAVTLRYDVYCVQESGDCDPGGTVYVRAGQSGAFQALPLQLDT